MREDESENRKTIMIVDDNDEIVELVKCMLSMEGYEIIDGCSGEDALYLNEVCHEDTVFISAMK